MTSQRLPGKVLMDLVGRPVLAWTIARIQQAGSVNRVVVATSDHESDDPVARYCLGLGVSCHRGPLEDVAQRMVQAALAEGAPAFLRISGDSPLIDPEIVDHAVRLYESAECDLATNVLVRSYPKGQSVEVLRTDTFDSVCADLIDAQDREHVTRIFYARPDRFRILAFTSGSSAGPATLAVDTREDLEVATRLIEMSDGKPGGWRELLELKEHITK